MNKGLDKAVDKVLSVYDDARNSDLYLVIRVYEQLGFDAFVFKDGSFQLGVYSPSSVKNLPAFESITRLRRHIQNVEKRHLPTDLDVLIKRKFSAEDLKIFFGEESTLYNNYLSYEVHNETK